MRRDGENLGHRYYLFAAEIDQGLDSVDEQALVRLARRPDARRSKDPAHTSGGTIQIVGMMKTMEMMHFAIAVA